MKRALLVLALTVLGNLAIATGFPEDPWDGFRSQTAACSYIDFAGENGGGC